ncbi:MAG: MBL fold metallo-hydrolase [Pseudoxanthomonas sp.]
MNEHGILTIDTAFQRDHFDAAYLIVDNGRGAFVDCGTNHSVPLLLSALEGAGLARDQVDWLIVTHVHLDHAGGAGLLMQHLPNARLVAHPRAAPHLIDPSKLIAGATAVYGDQEMQRSYGRIQAVAEHRVEVLEDGQTLLLAGRALEFLDTPGHARHHHCVWDARSQGWFTGDTFGLSYRELDSSKGAFVIPTSTPVQFEPEKLKASIDRLLERDPQWMYLTHYGRVGEVRRLARDLHAQIDAMVETGQACDGLPDRHRAIREALTALYLGRAREHGCPMDDAGVEKVLAMDIELNAQGLASWLDRDRR